MNALNPDLARGLILMVSFKGGELTACMAFLLSVGRIYGTVTGADLPGELTNGNIHLAGAAIKTLLTLGLLEVVGEKKSPHKNAHGRKVKVCRIPKGAHGKMLTWFSRNGIPAPESPQQLSLLA